MNLSNRHSQRAFTILAARILLTVSLTFLAFARVAIAVEKDTSPHSNATLISEVASIAPATPFTVALRLEMDQHWHSYWKNAGDAGLPTKIKWDLPKGFKAGPIQWPVPVRIVTPPLVSYGYEKQVLLLTQIFPPQNLPVGKSVTLKAHADWLVCEVACIPAKQDVSLTLPVKAAPAADNPQWKSEFSKTRDQLPRNSQDAGYKISATREKTEDDVSAKKARIFLRVQPPQGVTLSPEEWKDAYFYVGQMSTLESAAKQNVSADGDGLKMELTPSEYAEKPLKELDGVLIAPPGKSWDADGKIHSLAIETPITTGSAESTPAAATSTPSAGGTAPLSLGFALLFAFGGGMLLNLMPCVFPVLSLKILNFVQKSGEDKAKVKKHGLVFGLGVLVSFWALAGGLLLLRAAGGGVGWGYQLQSPIIVGALSFLMFSIALNLLGAFAISWNVGGVGLTRVGARSTQSGGYRSSFASGVLATILATPCTAPFMGAALGFALTQSTAVALLVFTALGVGVATPYVTLSMNPAWLKKLPKPGAWMETLKQLMAFPMLATALWLAWVFGLQTGIDGITMLLGAFLLASLAIWIWTRWSASSSTTVKAVARSLAVVSLALAVFTMWRGASSQSEVSVSAQNTATLQEVQWQPFSQEKIKELRAEGKPVFVDFTAAWCLTCQVNKRTTLTRTAVQEEFAKRGVALMEADWTRRDPKITRALESFGRSGVPVYALYSGAPTEADETPHLLPAILTEAVVFDALKDLPPVTKTGERSASVNDSQ